MSHSTIDPAVELRPAVRSRGLGHYVRQALIPLASLKITVVLFALSVALVFLGTLAMKDWGTWTVVKTYFRSFYVWIPFQVFVRFGQVFLGVNEKATVAGGIPFPGGWLIGAALLVNLLAAHLVRFKLSWRRSGILILHSGLAMLLLSELFTGLVAVEGNMIINQGETVNYAVSNQKSELAVVDASDSADEDVVAIPADLLRKGGLIRNDALPFDIEPGKYMVNSELADLPAGEKNPATAGAGLRTAAAERREVVGVDADQQIDQPSAYVTFRDRSSGAEIGTYLVSYFLKPQPVVVNGKRYQVELRMRRDYKPFSLTLIEFRYDRYLGTEMAKNYSSRVRLRDPELGVDREVVIRMNEPLRYRGETFYQSNFDKRTETMTVLQVVRNPGWLIPYFSCGLVTLGMAVHFGIGLTGFLKRRAGR
jgi:hypothetical protein